MGSFPTLLSTTVRSGSASVYSNVTLEPSVIANVCSAPASDAKAIAAPRTVTIATWRYIRTCFMRSSFPRSTHVAHHSSLIIHRAKERHGIIPPAHPQPMKPATVLTLETIVTNGRMSYSAPTRRSLESENEAGTMLSIDQPLKRTVTLSWSQGVSRYQWLVLFVAWLGWVFDSMDATIYALVLHPALHDLLHTGSGPPTAEQIGWYGGIIFSIFLIGWAIGGIT